MRMGFPYQKDAQKNIAYSYKEILALLANETRGHYLFGHSSFWHGGIHFTDKANTELKDKPIGCIADGVIVAYRINQTDCFSKFKGDKDDIELNYSTSFCLVKHEYESPEKQEPVVEDNRETLKGKVIELSGGGRNARNECAENNKAAEFTVTLPIGTQLKIASTGGTDNNFATVEIIAFANSTEKTLQLENQNKKGEQKTLNIGDKVYMNLFTKEGKIVLSKGKPLFKKIQNQEASKSHQDIPKTNKLTFYSLYMHLLPWSEYDANQLTSSDNKNYVITVINGVDERSSAAVPDVKKGEANNVTGTVTKGTIYEVTERKRADGFELAKGYQCNTEGKRQTKDEVWFKTGGANGKTPYIKEYKTPEQQKANQSTYKEIPVYWKHKASITAKTIKALTIYHLITDDKNVTHLAVKGVLESGGVFTYSSPADIQEKQVMVNGQAQTHLFIACKWVSGKIGKDSDAASHTFYLIHNEETLKQLREKVAPTTFDSVVEASMPVKQGDMLGKMGRYDVLADNKSQANVKHQLHFEIFTNDTTRIEPFLDNKAEAKYGRDYLVLQKGATLSIGSSPDALIKQDAADFPSLPAPYFAAKSPIVLHQWLIPLPRASKVAAKDKTEWYKIPIENLPEKTFGFIKITDTNVDEANQLDLRKVGFSIIQEHDKNTIGYAGDGFIDQEDEESIPQTKLFKQLFERIDTDKDNTLSQTEIAQAYKNPVLSDQLRRLVGYHPSEWQGKSDEAKWKKLEDYLTGEENEAVLQHEQARIDALTFWDEIPELKKTPIVYHFHPIEFVESIGHASWHDQVDNPMLCLYSQRGIRKPWHGSFGTKIRDGVNPHSGIDIFAKIGTPVYACVQSEVVLVEINQSMYGGCIYLKVLDKVAFDSKKNQSFKPKYENKTEVEKSLYFKHEDTLYCFYAHLSKIDVKKGQIVKAGDIIGLSGTSGDNGKPFITKNPHLHFEIRNKMRPKKGWWYRCNPCIYVNCKTEDTMSEEEKQIQTEEAKEDRTQPHRTTL